MSRLAILTLSWAAIGLAVAIGQTIPELGLAAIGLWTAGIVTQFLLAAGIVGGPPAVADEEKGGIYA